MNKAFNTIGQSPDWPLINEMVESGYITKRTHSEFPDLSIYNYSAKAQYDSEWNPATLMCRGLIAKREEVLARPFPKFFNYQEHEIDNVPIHLPYKVWEKLDGSLGISYVVDGEVRLSTRGSMESYQAIRGTQILKDKYPDWMPEDGLTYLFEIIYPLNKIVVDYGGLEDVVLLAILETSTGKNIAKDHPFQAAEYHGESFDLQSIPERDNCEGYVIEFDNGFRLKVKHEEYVRLHKIITGVSSRTVWEYLSEGKDFKELLDNVPDEFYKWLTSQKAQLVNDYEALESKARDVFESRPDTTDRKTIAAHFTPHGKLSCILFMMLDGKIYTDTIWKMVKPDRTMPYVDEN